MADLPPPPAVHQPVPAAAPQGLRLGVLPGVLLAVAVLYFARDLVIPLVLAVLLSFVLAPVVRGLRRIGLPGAVSVLSAVVVAVATLAALALEMGRQLTQLAANIPLYQAEISRKLSAIQGPGGWLERLQHLSREVSRGLGNGAAPAVPSVVPPGATGNAAIRPVPVELRPPPAEPLEVLRSVLEPLLHPLATAAIVVVLVIFVLLYREDLRDRLIRLAGARDLHRTVAAMDDAGFRLSRFFLAQSALNASYGVAMTVLLFLIGVPQPVLWGILAALMRFVPYVGSIIAAAPPILLALAADPGWTMPLLVLALYVVGEGLMGQVAEPLVFGHSTGLSPMAVMVAATFWTWLWGPVGLLLATPLTVCLVVLGRHVDRLEFLEVALGDRPPLDPPQAFYQRALAGDADGLAEQAELHLSEATLDSYHATVALPGLALAQADAARGAIGGDRVAAIRDRVAALIEDLAEEGEAPEGAPPPEALRAPGAVACIPARGPFDGLAAAMLAQVLARRGFGAEVAEALRPHAPPPAGARLAWLCALEGGTSAPALRYARRRLMRRLPGTEVAVLVLGGGEAARLPAALREDGARVAASLEEAARLPEGAEPPAGTGAAQALS